MSKIFENNIKALLEKNENLANKLLKFKTNKNFEVIQQGEDVINLNIIDKKNNYPIYETSPLKEIELKQKELKKYERYPYLFFYGLGNGILIKLIFANPSHKKIFVFEPNIEIIFIAFHIVDLSNEIKNDKIEIILSENFNFPYALRIFTNKEIIVFSKTYELIIQTPYYEKIFKEDIIKINQTIIRGIKQAIINLGNDTIDTLIGIEHHIKNLPEMIQNYTFKQLLNKKNSEVAIIVSTGPSLTKQLPLLKEIQNYVTIISVDASMPILEKWGIKPDLVTSLERVEATGEFFKNTSPKFQKDIIMLHASLQHRNVLDNSYGKKILVMRPFRYTKFYNLERYGYLGYGMSAANMAHELAIDMNYKYIALIGQDLAYSEDGTSHSEGHIFGKDEVKFKESDEYVTKYGGKGTIRTSRVWNMFRNFFEKQIHDSLKNGIFTFNCTEGGARIERAIEMPFKSFIKEYVKPINKKTIKLKLPPQKSINKNLLKAYKKTKEMLDYAQKAQIKIEKVFLAVAKECENLERLKENNQLEKINFPKLYKLSNKIDRVKDLIETRKFSMIFGETIESYLVNKELNLAQVMVRPSNTEIEKKAKIIEWIMQHKEWLFMLAGSINAQKIVIQRSISNLENELKKRELI